jgi:lipopolysaccharide export system permease protein
VVKQAMDEGLSLLHIMQIVPIYCPEALGTLPGSTLLAASLVYGRMSGANEVVAIKSLGINPMVILWPVFVFSFLLSLTSVWLNDVAVSWGHNNVQRVVVEAIDDIVYGVLRTQKSYRSKWFTITVRRVEDRRLVHTTIIFAARGKLPPITIMAEEAEIHVDSGQNMLVFSFDNATIHGGSMNGFFKHHEIGFTLDDASGKADTRSHPSHLPLNSVPSEMKRQVAVIESLEQALATKAAYSLLLGEFEVATGKNWDVDNFTLRESHERLYRLGTESPRRWAQGFSCLFFVLVGAPMAIRKRNAEYLAIFFSVFAPVLLAYYPLLLLALDRAKLGTLPGSFVWLGNIVFAAWGAWLLRRVIRF